jgi:uncharacterized delta-60 repeat protein
MECKRVLALKVTLLLTSVVFTVGCSLDARITSLSTGQSSFNNNPESSLPTPEPPSAPAISKPSGDPFFNGNVNNMKIDSQGNRIFAGDFSSFTFHRKNYVSKIARLNSDGRLDESFNTGLGFNSSVRKMILNSSQEIILTGEYSSFNATSANKIMKILPNGNKETSFAPGIYSKVFDLALTSDQKIIAIGDFYYWDTFADSQESIVRINPDGTRDTSFTIGSSFSPVRTATTLDIQTNGKIVIGGSFNSYSGNSSPKIVRLNSNGTYDNTFLTGTGFNGTVYDVAVLSDGGVVVVGDFTSYNGSTGVNRIAKLSASGAIDSAFKINVGSGFVTSPKMVKEIPGVGIMVGGPFDSFNGSAAKGIVCLNFNGGLCSGINLGSGATYGAQAGEVKDIALLNSTTLLLAGSFTEFNSLSAKNLVALNLDGSPSNLFASFKGLDFDVNGILIQSDGKVVLGGDFSLYDPIRVNGVAKFSSDKTLDEDFTSKVLNYDNIISVADLMLDSSDGVWLGGFIGVNGNHAANNIMKLRSDGTIDSSCASSMGTGFNFFVNRFVMQNDGKMIVNGSFDTFNGSSASRVLRLDASCNLDSTFHANSTFVGGVSSSYVLSDGKILHVGSMSNYASTSVNKVIRVLANGTLDTTYPNNAVKPAINASFVDSSDRLYIASASGTFNGTAVSNLSRILPNGIVDSSFNVGTGFDTIPTVIKVLNNKVYVGGGFTSFNSLSRKYFIILNEDGTENTTTPRPEAVLPVKDIIFNSVTGEIEFAYSLISPPTS